MSTGSFAPLEPTIRPDLRTAHERAWDSLAEPGTWWSARERRALAQTAVIAMWSPAPPPPWASPEQVVSFLGAAADAPLAAHVAAVRMARHASTITREWYEAVAAEIGEFAYVELVGIVCVVAATTSLRRTLGLAGRDLPAAGDDGATRTVGPATEPARLNWVPVAAPADSTAAVVQALTAVPSAHSALWSLADVQYIPDAEMVDPLWTRGTLARSEMELVAVSVSAGRECHY